MCHPKESHSAARITAARIYMKLVVFTIVKNGMPFIPTIFFNLQATKLDWRWIVAEGAAKNTHCTAWCNQQEPGLSTDGTSEFLDMISKHPRVTILRKEMWDGKIEQCNACLAEIKEPCVLLQQDSDELWRPDALERMVELFTRYADVKTMYFWCSYYLGLNVITTSFDGYGNRDKMEWLRAWRFEPGNRFSRHEPPIMDGNKGRVMSRDETRKEGFGFRHYAWWSENQVAYKEQFYNYPNALQCWRNLQSNTTWPVTDLKKFLPWVGTNASADKLA